MDLKGKRVLVYGAGISGIGSAKLLEQVGAIPVVYEGNGKLTEKDVLAKFQEGTKAIVVIGELTQDVLNGVDMAVLSPGVPCDIPQVDMIREAGIPIWGEVELAYQCGSGMILAITGTNGKTTTTTLVGEIMRYHAARGTAPLIDRVFGRGRDQQLPARNDRYFPPESECHYQYHTGSSQPASYAGGIYQGQGTDLPEPDTGRLLCAEL